MSYESERDSISRTPQDLIKIGVRSCQNHYSTLVQQLFTRTEEFDHADWLKSSTTVSADDATAPDGTETADTVTFNATADNIRQFPASTIVTSKAFTASFWMRVPDGTGTQQLTLRMTNTGFTEEALDVLTITETWTRYFIYKLFSGTPVDNLLVRIERRAGDDITDLELWGANVTENPSALDEEIAFPYIKRVDEAVGTVSVNASRCEAADAGDGSRCYYSRPSCQDPDNFNIGNDYEGAAEFRGFREFLFCRTDAPLAIKGENVSPLLEQFDTAAQEIDPLRGVTVNERVVFRFNEEAAPGLWNPLEQWRGALVNTATGQGTFWRRFLAIYRNYANPKGYLFLNVGFVEDGATESDYQQRGKYLMQNITIRADDKALVECTDRLKINRKKIPAKIASTNLTRQITSSSQLTLKVDDASEVSEPAWNATAAAPDFITTIEVDHDSETGGNEKMIVTARDLENNELTVLRGRWGTQASRHKDNVKWREIVEFGTERTDPTGVPFGKNPLDIIRELYKYAGIANEDIDNDTFDSERDLWLYSNIDLATATETGVLFRRTLVKEKKVEDLIKEIRQLVQLLVWIDENQQVTCKLFAPPIPTETITVIDDDSNLIHGTIEVDDSDETRITRGLLAWDLNEDEDGDVPEDYDLIEIYIALDEEEEPYYGEQRAQVIMTEWLRETDLLNPAQLISRIVNRFRFGARTFRWSLEIKDDAIKVGKTFQIETSKLQAFDGSNDPRFVVVTRKKRSSRPGTLEYDGIEMPYARVFFWAPDGLPDYDSATAANKRYGYWSDDQGLVGAKKELGYHWW